MGSGLRLLRLGRPGRALPRRAPRGDRDGAGVVPGARGTIEFATTFYGVKRAHLVLGTGTELPLSPHPRTPEAWRQRFAERHPVASGITGAAAVVVLVLGLVVAGMSLLDTVTHVPQVADRLGATFDSPVALSGPAATALTVAGVLAIIERAVSMRHHWLLDADTWWSG